MAGPFTNAQGEQYVRNILWNGYDANLRPEVVRVLNEAQRYLEFPISLSSGYRSAERNRAVQGAKRSQHLTGNAVDISLRGLNDNQRELLTRVLVQAGANRLGVYSGNTAMHLDMHEQAPRGGYPVYMMYDESYDNMDYAPDWFTRGAKAGPVPPANIPNAVAPQPSTPSPSLAARRQPVAPIPATRIAQASLPPQASAQMSAAPPPMPERQALPWEMAEGAATATRLNAGQAARRVRDAAQAAWDQQQDPRQRLAAIDPFAAQLADQVERRRTGEVPTLLNQPPAGSYEAALLRLRTAADNRRAVGSLSAADQPRVVTAGLPAPASDVRNVTGQVETVASRIIPRTAQTASPETATPVPPQVAGALPPAGFVQGRTVPLPPSPTTPAPTPQTMSTALQAASARLSARARSPVVPPPPNRTPAAAETVAQPPTGTLFDTVDETRSAIARERAARGAYRAVAPEPPPPKPQGTLGQMVTGIGRARDQLAEMFAPRPREPSWFEQQTGNPGSRGPSPIEMLGMMNVRRIMNSQRQPVPVENVAARARALQPGIGGISLVNTVPSGVASNPAVAQALQQQAPASRPPSAVLSAVTQQLLAQQQRPWWQADNPNGQSLSTPTGSPFW